MARVGIRQLKNRLSDYMNRVRAGERLIVTDRGRPIAVVIPAGTDKHIETLLGEQLVRWGGGKPRGARTPIKVKAAHSLSDAVLHDRT